MRQTDPLPISHIVSWTFFGMFLGAVTGGWFSDRVGRKRALLLTTAWYSGFSLLNAAVQSTMGLSATRLLTGVGLSAMTVIGMTYFSEIFPAKQRGAYQGWVMTIGLIGIPVTAYVARFTVPVASWGWRLVFLWGAMGLVVLLFANHLEESPRWYENHGRPAEADAVLDRIEARSHRIRRVTAAAGSRRACAAWWVRRPRLAGVSPPHRNAGYGLDGADARLLWLHRLGPHTARSARVFAGAVLTWSSAMAIGAVPGALISALISDRWQRKWSIVRHDFKLAAIVIFGFLVAMFTQTFAPLLYAYTPECYPTQIRNSGAGIGYGVGRLANAFGPLIVAFLFNHYGYKSVFVYVAAMWLLVAAIVSAFGPSTRAQTFA